MNRRGFLTTLLKAGASFAILPAATTYARSWRAQVIPFNPLEFAGKWSFVGEDLGRGFNLIRYECVDGVYRKVPAGVITPLMREYVQAFVGPNDPAA